ncbi:MAG: protein-ADP-ribose hydrolase [Actinomycetaceae bacterium]|nr:protein-ADP-ribose hydrolase [Actinomycetaceae bacterium]
MQRQEQVEYLIERLLDEMPEYRLAAGEVNAANRRALLRALMNIRPPRAVDESFLTVQDTLLSAERDEKGIVSLRDLRGDEAISSDVAPVQERPAPGSPELLLWQGDITRLAVDGIVNAANSKLLGCFAPNHRCIDNAIHSAAGVQLREECARIMSAQGHDEATGDAKITAGYNLPASYVLHTVGPIVNGSLTDTHREQLTACYRSCLHLALDHELSSIAFCCISTGEFHFPHQEAAQIAVETVRNVLAQAGSTITVVFNVFKEEDRALYSQFLQR